MSDDKHHFEPPSVRSERAVLSTMSGRSSEAGVTLPLLSWEPPRQVLLFPLVNRVGKVRHTARLLSRKHGDDATLYWKQVIASNRKHLSRIGLDDDQIDAELRTFFDAVQSELVRISYFEQSNGGAA